MAGLPTRLGLSRESFLNSARTAVAALGALIATFLNPNWMVYGAGIFVCGIVCSVLCLAAAYRFAAITLSIVLLVAHQRPAWIVASHRFVEVSLGIAVALVVTLVWHVPGSKVG